MTKLTTLTLLLAAVAGADAFTAHQPSAPSSTQLSSTSNSDVDAPLARRNFLASAATAAAALPLLAATPLPAAASGGATAGKYTTIPIAKRRYYGRVQEAVHEFLLMAPAVIKGDLTDPTVQVSVLQPILRYATKPFQGQSAD